MCLGRQLPNASYVDKLKQTKKLTRTYAHLINEPIVDYLFSSGIYIYIYVYAITGIFLSNRDSI